MNKSHIEHAVCLIKHKILYLVQVYMSLAHQIKQASRSCDQNINAFMQHINLWTLIHTAKDTPVTHTGIF